MATVRERLENAVAADLAENGITLVLSQGGRTHGDAWVDATRHGDRVANIHLLDGNWATMQHQPGYQWIPVTSLKVSFPFDDTSPARIAVTVLAVGHADLPLINRDSCPFDTPDRRSSTDNVGAPRSAYTWPSAA
jgi:hypothetical protein